MTRANEAEKWGGDLVALYAIKEGMEKLGHSVQIGSTTEKIADADFVFLSNTCLDLRACYHFVRLLKKPYGVIGFHEDFIQYFGPSRGFYHYVREILKGNLEEGVPFSLDQLYENPHLIHYYAPPPAKRVLLNYEILKNATVCIANSPTEAQTMRRDCPSCNAQVVYWSSGLAEAIEREPHEEFLTFTGLEKRGYLLQVGRFEMRKNQLATILATKDFALPLVFIATATALHSREYLFSCLEAIHKWRKGPTLIVSQELPSCQSGQLTVLQMPQGEKLSPGMLLSAVAHAGLHVHPAFHELPGYTYLESAKLGVPTIASTWTSIRDYFTDEKTGEYSLDKRIEYCLPYDLPGLTQLVWKKWGESFSQDLSHPAFTRTKVDVAREILRLILS